MPRDRGIGQVKVFSGGFLDQVAARIRRQGKVRVLDAGCGHGVVMLGLVKRFGAGIEVVGFNYSREHGGPRQMRMQAIKKGLYSAREYGSLRNKPSFVYLDAGERLPFRSKSFDFVYSASAIYLFDDKVRFFEECNRILRMDGVARLEVADRVRTGRQPGEYARVWEIWDKGKLVRPQDYFARFDGIRIGTSSDPDVFGIEMSRRSRRDFGLRFVGAVDANFIWHRWMGVKSIYTTQRAFKPYWK